MGLEEDAYRNQKPSIEEDNPSKLTEEDYRRIGKSLRPRSYDFIERTLITLGSHAIRLHFNDFLIPEHEEKVRRYFSRLDVRRGKQFIGV